MSENIIGYTIGIVLLNDIETRVLVTIEILDNDYKKDRDDIIDKQYARYYTKQFKVLDIEDNKNNKYLEAKSYIYIINSLIHKVGEITENEEIPYYIDRDRVYKYKLSIPVNGQYISYGDNGSIITKCLMKNKKYDGLYEMFYHDGKKLMEIDYKNGKINGKYNKYYYNGVKQYEYNFVNDKLDGEYIKRNRENLIVTKGNYKLGKYHGLYQEWFNSEGLKREIKYDKGKIIYEKKYDIFGKDITNDDDNKKNIIVN